MVFLVLGAGVYQVTAPAAPADAPGFSVGRLVQFAKGHFGGPRERRTVTRTATLVPSAEITSFDLRDFRGAVTISGSDRPDIAVRAEITLGGVDEAHLNDQEAQLGLTLEGTGTTAALRFGFDHHATGRRPRYVVHVEVPSRFTVRLGGEGSAEVSLVAGLQLDGYAGDLRADALTGPVTGRLRRGRAEFGPGAVLDLETERGHLRAEKAERVTLNSERTTLDLVDAAGPITLEQDFCRIEIRGTGGPVHVTGEGGVIALRGVRHPLTIDAERLTVNAELEAPVVTAITVENDDVEVTLPRDAGMQLQASVDEGGLVLPAGLTATTDGTRQSVSGALAGGGPEVKLAVTRGDLRVRTR
ncbi:MAG: hypothetical protein H0V80_12330 [Acidobacteria bacterium]|nr:hypothetical protein [Acidobacteriota bacterium]